MHAFGNILIFHPAAIGDAMLATPVAKTLKLNFPGAKITYWSHPSLKQLLFGICPSVDEFVEFSKDDNIFSLIGSIKKLKPDLFVDLSNSSRSQWLDYFTRAHIVRYEKDRGLMSNRHAVDNFLDCIKEICPEKPDQLFPTIFPEALAREVLPRVVNNQGNFSNRPFLGIIPGVGKIRAHRSWLQDAWLYLLQAILDKGSHCPVLIGGEDEMRLASDLENQIEHRCLNLVGKLTLAETAAVLKNCDVVVSGDTGPAHLAVAVGTPVIGLYGPTFPWRSGPYGCSHLVVDQSSACQCHDLKYCRVAPERDPGACMDRIMLPEVIEKLGLILPGFAIEQEEAPRPEMLGDDGDEL